MASSPAKICAVKGQYLLLPWCQENIVVPQDPEQKSATASQGHAVVIREFSDLTAISDFNDGASIGEVMKQHSSNSEPIDQIFHNPEKLQSFLNQAALEIQTQAFDQNKRLD